jgi:hypothetical protein
MLLIKTFLALSFFFLFVKIYYSIKLGNKNINRVSIFGKMMGGVYGIGVFFPILRKPGNAKEKRIIQIANIAVSLFWSFFFIAMLVILLQNF